MVMMVHVLEGHQQSAHPNCGGYESETIRNSLTLDLESDKSCHKDELDSAVQLSKLSSVGLLIACYM